MNHPCRQLAVVSINRNKYSETFIHDSFDFFPCQKTLLYGDYLPTHFTTDVRQEGDPIPEAKSLFDAFKPKKDTDAQRVYNLKTWLKKQRPDVVLAHYGPSGAKLAPICAELGLPLVVHFHGYDAYRLDILSRYHYHEMFAQARALVVSSHDMHRQLLTLSAPEKKIHTYSYGVDVKRFTPQSLSEGPLTFLFVGRFVHKKAPDVLVRAFDYVRTQVTDARLYMVGDGELLEHCQGMAAELGLTDSITFFGVLSPEAVVQKLAECHALVLPSRRTEMEDSEGTPLVILEAGAAARAVISTLHGGIPDVITHAENGLLVPENDWMRLAEAMVDFACDHPAAAFMGENGRRIVMNSYRQESYHQKLWNLLNHAVSHPRNA